MAIPDSATLTYYEGDDVAYSFLIRHKNGDPIDLTGATVRCQVRDSFTGPVVVEGVCALVGPGTDGRFDMTLTAADTRTLAGDGFIYDIQVEDSAGSTRTYLRGRLEGCREVTR